MKRKQTDIIVDGAFSISMGLSLFKPLSQFVGPARLATCTRRVV